MGFFIELQLIQSRDLDYSINFMSATDYLVMYKQWDVFHILSFSLWGW
jgi:hypothetical protein